MAATAVHHAANSSVRARGASLASLLRAIAAHAHFRLALANFMCGLLPDFASGFVRGRVYRLIGIDVGPGAYVMGNLDLTGGVESFYGQLHIGAGASVGTHVTMNLDAEVRLGTNVSLGPFVKIYTGTHPIGPGSNRRLADVIAKPVEIQDGSWIGLGATILPGVTVGHGSIVAAGAVVDQDVAPNSYVAGNPAAVVQQLPWGDR